MSATADATAPTAAKASKAPVETITSVIKSAPKKTSNCRLYCKAHFAGHKRGKHIMHPSTSLLKIDGVHSTKDATWYIGKTVIYGLKKKGGKPRLVKGKVIKAHGNSGVVCARFEKNLPAVAHGCRVMLYPSNI